jgi:diguanylate cyclase (GGDEF)-like protein/PAS domain S-box-containing protein
MEMNITKTIMGNGKVMAKPVRSDAFLNAIKHAPIGMALVSLDGIWLHTNEALCKLLGYTKDELAELSIQNITHPEDQEAEASLAQQLLIGKIDSYNVEKRCFRKDGSIAQVMLTGTLAYSDMGEPEFFVVQVLDISQQRQSEADCDAFFALSPDLLAVADARGYLIHVSPAWTDLLGWSKEELQACPFLEFVHPDDRERTIKEAQSLYGGNATKSFRNRYRHRDGSYLWLEWNTRIVAHDRFYCVVRDVTSHEQTEALHRSELKAFDAASSTFRLATKSTTGDLAAQIVLASQLFESSSDCVKILDLEGHLLLMNQNGQCMMQIDDFCNVRGESWAANWPSESRATVLGAVDKALNGKTGHFSAFCPTAKGQPRWWDVHVNPIFDEHGQVAELLAISRDVTAVHQAKEELRETATRLNQITANIPATLFQWYARANGEMGFYYVSEKCEELYGVTPEELVADWTRINIHRDDMQGLLATLEYAKCETKEWQFECRLLSKDLSVRRVRARSTATLANERETVFTGVIIDITQEYEAAEARRSQEEKIRLLMENVHEAFVGMNQNGIICEWNKQAEITFGWSAEEAVGNPVAQLVVPERFRARLYQAMAIFRRTGKSSVINQRIEMKALCKSGREISVEMTIGAVKYQGQYYFHAFMHDISERKEIVEKLYYQATHDFLTGLSNRFEFMGRLERAVHAKKRSAHPDSLVLLFIDLDGFKQINDTLGHEAGDDVLVEFGKRLKRSVRMTDTIARLAGDEFVVLIDHVHNGESDADVVASKILFEAGKPFLAAGSECSVGASIGMAVYDGNETTDEFLSRADSAMYIAKQTGKNQISGQAVTPPQVLSVH